VRATPVARNLARAQSLDLRRVPGSGPRGRIYRADVERYLASQSSARLPADSSQARPAAPETASRPPILLPQARERGRAALKGARAIIARRMAYSAQTIPHVHVSLAVDMREAARLRERLNPVYQQQHGRGVSYTAILAHAAARLLPSHPSLNSSLDGDEIIFWEDVHLGIATDLEDSLVVPVVREAHLKTLEQIALEISDLAQRARARKLQPAEMTGSTFTISNLGMLGAASFTAIINPPETAILAVGQIVDTPVAAGKKVAIRPLAHLTLAVDHRVTDGAQATRFLTGLKELLENPYLLL
jgi:pyruvate dehydrogenase E2 component (dihydrolipoamide acetyltransferase)